MSHEKTACVFLGSRENAVRAYSQLVAREIEAEVAEMFGIDEPEALGGPGISRVFVAPNVTERAMLVLAELDFN